MPGLIITDEAFEIFQLNVAELPAVILIGSTVKELMIGRTVNCDGVSGGVEVADGAEEVTITWIVAVLDPPSPVAVRVYIVDFSGRTLRLPLRDTLPIS
jgi:hypothetical protein